MAIPRTVRLLFAVEATGRLLKVLQSARFAEEMTATNTYTVANKLIFQLATPSIPASHVHCLDGISEWAAADRTRELLLVLVAFDHVLVVVVIVVRIANIYKISG